MPTYKSLKIQYSNVKYIIEEFCSNNSKCNGHSLRFINLSGVHHRCIISNTSGQEYRLVDIWDSKNGITVKSDDDFNTEISEELAWHIKESAQPLQKNRSFQIKNFDPHNEGYFDLLIEYISEIDNVNFEKKGNHLTKQYKFENEKKSDKITLTLHSNNTLQVQGKPWLLHAEVMSLLSELNAIDFDGVISTQSEFFEVPIDDQVVDDDISSILVNSRDFLGTHLVNILASSVIYRSVNIPMPEYSSTTIPAFRGLEGYLKLLFKQIGVTIDKFGFSKDKISFDNIKKKHVVHNNIVSQLDPEKMFIVQAIEKCYTHYNNNRHTYSHVSVNIVSTGTITDKRIADTLILDTLNLIESTYLSCSTYIEQEAKGA
ncbi:type II toxin-antitoxin system RnlA family toxin [Shouchella patagoniensis]|uniref:type II toxin-antitoxin system RnlA family toxin n=1 Tax=Shouchella patagoniensis TaxID=228576 RepID=UPI0014740514|nr:type II toxin-antitoxin system RnlA family toxin [Shouchella patagoniensis]